MKFPILHTERLNLIEIQQHHLHDLYSIFSNPDVTRFYNLLPFKKHDDGQVIIDWYHNRFRAGNAIRWGIIINGNTNLVGTIGFNSFENNNRANIGYDLHKSHWNCGYITEALKTVTRFGFEHLKLNRIEAEVMPGNAASERVLEKVGFTKECLLRNWMCWNEKHYDMLMYSLLKEDLSLKERFETKDIEQYI